MNSHLIEPQKQQIYLQTTHKESKSASKHQFCRNVLTFLIKTRNLEQKLRCLSKVSNKVEVEFSLPRPSDVCLNAAAPAAAGQQQRDLNNKEKKEQKEACPA